LRLRHNWTPLTWLNSSGHRTGFTTSDEFNKEKVFQDWTSFHCQQLGLPIPHLYEFTHHECPCKRRAIDAFGDHLHSCCRVTQHAGATMGAHEHMLTAVKNIFAQARYRTDCKNVPHGRGLKKADLVIKDFRLAGVRNVILDVSLPRIPVFKNTQTPFFSNPSIESSKKVAGLLRRPARRFCRTGFARGRRGAQATLGCEDQSVTQSCLFLKTRLMRRPSMQRGGHTVTYCFCKNK
jgi:hypothetical protein